ncbi:glycosyltransferase family 2 protein [candidate division KSB1 bacterium]
MSQIEISTIIVSYNNPEYLRKCIGSLNTFLPGSGSEIIVVDNNSSDNNVKVVKNEFPDVLLIENSENTGYSQAINQGLEAARGIFCAIMNSDVEFTSDVFTPIMDYIRNNDKTGIAGCTLEFPDGSPQRSYYRFPSFLSRLAYFTGINKIINAESLTKISSSEIDNEVVPVDVVCGAFFIVERETLQSIDGFDPDYFLYFEEVDACYRLHQKGYNNVIFPFLKVIHYGRHYETPDNQIVYFQRNRSLLIYYFKNFSRFRFYSLWKLNIVFLSLKWFFSTLLGTFSKKWSDYADSHLSVIKYHYKFLRNILDRKRNDFP